MVCCGYPRDRRGSASWMYRHRLEYRSVAVAPGAELVRVTSLERALPDTHVVVEDAPGRGPRVKVEVLSDLATKTRSQQQSRGFDGASRYHYGPSVDRDLVAARP